MTLMFPTVALLKREFLSLLRSTRSYVVLVLFVLAGVVAAGMIWPDMDYRFAYGGMISRELMLQIAMLLLGACAVFVPALAATSIVVEREQETFEGLLTTLIRPSGIVAGKLLNTIGFFLLLTIAVLPLGGVVFFLVGVDWRDFAQAFLLILSCAFSCAMAGILSSARFRRTLTAAVVAYLGAAFGLFSPLAILVIVAFIRDVFDIGGASGYITRIDLWGDQFPISPVHALTALFSQRLSLAGFLIALLAQVIFGALCFYLTLRVLRRPQQPAKAPGFKPIDDPTLLRLRRTTWPFYLIDPMRRHEPIEDGRNPMLVREIRWGVVSRGTFLIRMFLVSFGFCLLSSFGAVTGTRLEDVGVWFVALSVFAVLLAPAFLANAFTKEHELGNIDMLRLTLLRPHEVVLGKLFAGAVVVAPMFLGALAASASLFIARAYTWPLLLSGYATLALCFAVSVCLGLFASLLTRRTSTALILTYLFMVILFVGWLPVLLWRPLWFSYEVKDRLLLLASPIVTFIEIINHIGARQRGEYFARWAASVFFYSVWSLVLIRVSLAVFIRRWQRDA